MMLFLAVFLLQLDAALTETDKAARPHLDEDESIRASTCEACPGSSALTHAHNGSGWPLGTLSAFP